ncbi:MAG: shikimate kinase [Clostridiaceae bacterium]|nr:shikimate kinase [Clostridiaceae bacterium]
MNKNIVLIGMSGSGKTTIGKALSKALNKELIDIDLYIEKTQGKSISEIFNKGEVHFRDIESHAVLKVSKNTNCIISTGGGVIKNEVNMKELKKNSIVIYIDRPVEMILKDIDDTNRPLLKNNKTNLYEMYESRDPLYKKYSDIIVVNDGNEEEVINKIIDILGQLQ